MKALVLSGGGAKGSYQIGAWKALKKLHIKFDIVTGTSVGALNGAMVTQNSYRRAISLWKKINLEVLFNETVDLSVLLFFLPFLISLQLCSPGLNFVSKCPNKKV